MNTSSPTAKPIKPVNPLNKTTLIAKQAITISVISVVVAIIAIIFALLNYQTSVDHNQALNKTLNNISSAQNTLTDLSNKVHNQAAETTKLEQTFTQLSNSQNIPLQQTLAETGYLVHLANLHLTIGHDKTTALHILKVAKQHLSPVNNTAFLGLKQALTSDIEQLNKTPLININDTYLQLTQLSTDIFKLSPLPLETTDSVQKTLSNIKHSSNQKTPWYLRFWDSIKDVKEVFIIHKIKNPTLPITEPSKIYYIKENIRIQLSMAQWALLHQNQLIFSSSIKTVIDWLEQYFSMQPKADPIITKLKSLYKLDIDQKLPSLNNTLKSLSTIKLSQPNQQPVLDLKKPSNPPPKKQKDEKTSSETPSVKTPNQKPVSVET